MLSSLFRQRLYVGKELKFNLSYKFGFFVWWRFDGICWWLVVGFLLLNSDFSLWFRLHRFFNWKYTINMFFINQLFLMRFPNLLTLSDIHQIMVSGRLWNHKGKQMAHLLLMKVGLLNTLCGKRRYCKLGTFSPFITMF